MWILKIDLWRVAFNTQNNEDLSFVISCFTNLQYRNMIIYCICILYLTFSVYFILLYIILIS